MTENDTMQSQNALQPDKQGTPARSLAEGQIERLREKGGLFVEAVRATRMPMAVTDPSLPGNPIVFANEAFLQVSGYSLAEVLGQQPHFMNGEETELSDAIKFREALDQDRDEVLETIQYRKDGSRFVASVFLSAFKDHDGRTLNQFLSYLDITRRVEAEAQLISRGKIEAELRASEARYRSLFESMDEAYAVVEVIADDTGRWCDFRFLEVNPAFMAHTTMPYPVGRTATELLGTPNPRWAEMYGRVAETGESVRFEEQELTLGRVFDLNVFRLGGAGSRRVAVLFTDITGRKQAEEELRLAAVRDAYRVALTDALRSATDPVEAQGAAMRVLGDHLGASRVMYGEADAGSAVSFTNHREYRRDTAMPSSLGQHRWDHFGPYVAAEMQAGRTLVVPDVRAHPRHSAEELAAYETVGIRAYLAVPLIRDGQIVAYLAVNHATAHAWTPDEIALVEETAERTWAAVAGARAEAALRESESRLAAAFESVPVGIAVIDKSGAAVISNAEYRRFLPEGVIPLRDTARVGLWRAWDAQGLSIEPADFPGARALRGESVVPGQEMLFTDRAGRTIWTSVAIVPIRNDEGRIAGAVAVIADIDAAKRSAEALRESEERLRQFGEASSDVLWTRDARTLEWQYLTPAFETIYGLSREEALSGDTFRNWTDLILPEDRETAVAAIERVRAGERATFEYRIRRPSDAAVRWLRNTDFPIHGSDGTVQRIGGVGHDVTELKLAEAVIAASEQRFRSMAEVIEDVFYMTDLERRSLLYLSPSYERVWGRSPAGLLTDLSGFMDTIHPDDREQARAGMERQAQGEPVAVEYRIVRPDGSVRWIMDRSFPVTGQEGRLTAGLASDITEHKLLALRLTSLVEGIPQLVWRAVDHGEWTWASPQWTAFTGLSDQDSRDWGWLDAVHPDDRQSAREAWGRSIQTNEFRADYRVLEAATGSYRFFQTRATPVCDERGDIIEWLGTSTDVQEMREFQDRQAVMVAELQHRTRNLITVVRSVAQQTMALTGPGNEFQAQFNDRLAALSRVQGLLSQASEEKITIGDLIRMELDALGADGFGDRVVLDGPEVALRNSIVQTLALALHELATNARKHGALATHDGTLNIVWLVMTADGDGPRLRLEWLEEGIAAARREKDLMRIGYGRELIERALPYALSAKTSFELGDSGVRCTIDLPLKKSRGQRSSP